MEAGSAQLSSPILGIPLDTPKPLLVTADALWLIIIFRENVPSQGMEESGNLVT